MKRESALPRQSQPIRDKYPHNVRLNMYVQRWNRGPDYPVKLWDEDGRRSVPGHLMSEAGVPPKYLDVDGMPSRRYLHTHVVPDDVVPIRASWAWLVDKVVPREIADNMQPEARIIDVPICLLSDKPITMWDLLIMLNDLAASLDIETDEVIKCMTWQTRAYWIRETLRTVGVCISFRRSYK